MNNIKNILGTILLIIVVGSITYAVYGSVIHIISLLQNPSKNSPATTVCTLDAFQCADGSWVGRSGSNCQFVCPIPTPTSAPSGTSKRIEVKLNQTVTPFSEAITVLSLLEDSRCPVDVQCIQAGTVRVRIQIKSGLGVSVTEVTLGKSVTTESEEIAFLAVRPENESTKEIKSMDYRFVFQVTKRN